MTDFGAQGKTCPNNVCDLNNLTTHQSYYTALSQSASAMGTLILQGFDPWKFTGKCSGALHQEFRELEILDDITKSKYEGNCHQRYMAILEILWFRPSMNGKASNMFQIWFIQQFGGQ